MASSSSMAAASHTPLTLMPQHEVKTVSTYGYSLLKRPGEFQLGVELTDEGPKFVMARTQRYVFEFLGLKYDSHANIDFTASAVIDHMRKYDDAGYVVGKELETSDEFIAETILTYNSFNSSNPLFGSPASEIYGGSPLDDLRALSRKKIDPISAARLGIAVDKEGYPGTDYLSKNLNEQLAKKIVEASKLKKESAKKLGNDFGVAVRHIVENLLNN